MSLAIQRVSVAALSFACAAASSQNSLGPIPDESSLPAVTIWTSQTPLEQAAADSRFSKIAQWTIISVDCCLPGNYTGPEHADKFASIIKANRSSPGRVAVSIIGASLGNLNWPAGNPGAFRIPALLAHESDRLDPSGVNPNFNAQTPWKTHGIIEAAAWMQSFVARLNEYVVSGDIPAPNRFLFQDEPADFFDRHKDTLSLQESHLPNLSAYWTSILQDDRFNTVRVSGFGNNTLSQLWNIALQNGIVAPSVPAPGTYQPHLLGGSVQNQRWVIWFRGLMRQAEAGAMQQAFYQTIHATFPNAKCSDYDRSMRFDGLNSNSWIAGDVWGARGVRTSWDGHGDLQAPSLYPNAGPDHYFPEISPDSFALTRDSANRLEWCPVEPMEHISSRIHRFNLDAMTRSFGGQHKDTVAPWITLPGQHWFLDGSDGFVPACGPTPLRMPGQFGAGVRYVTSCDYTRRTLAQIRARGSAEFNVWSTASFGASTSGIPVNSAAYNSIRSLNNAIHPQKAFAWSRLAQIVDQVWGFTLASASVTRGGTAGSVSGPVRSLTYAFGDPLKLRPASGGAYRTEVLATFTNAYTTRRGRPDFLRVNIESAASSTTVISVWVKNFIANTWHEVDLDPVTGGIQNTANVPGNSSNASGSPGPTRRLSGRVAVTAAHFGSQGEVIVRLATGPMTNPSNASFIAHDLVQIIAEDDIDFSPADLNVDGIVDFADVDTFYTLQFAANDPLTARPPVLSFADFNQDGVVNEADESQFMERWSEDVE